MITQDKVLICMVCTGNICRSPTAHGVVQAILQEAGLGDRVVVESAGTHDYHVGEPPDERAQRHAKQRGYDLSALRARRFGRRDLDRYDLVLAMDRGHLRILRSLARPEQHDKIRLFMQYAGDSDVDEVPDPYYGGPEHFERVLDMVEAAAHGLVKELKTRYLRVST